MKKALAIAAVLALSITPTASFAHHLELKESEIRPGGDLTHTNLSGRDLSGTNLHRADLSGADLSNANLRGANLSNINANNLKNCTSFLPTGWFCEYYSLIQR